MARVNYLISYPRSGRAWFRAILKHMHDRGGFLTRRVHHSHDDATDATIGRYDACKKHWHESDRRLVLLTRDPRDVIVSHYLILKNRTVRFDDKWGDMSIDDWVRQPIGLPFAVRFLNDWANDPWNEVCRISFEALKRDVVSEVRRAFEFWGIAGGIDYRLARDVTMDFVRSQHPHSNDKSKPEAMAARRGEVGVSHEYLPPDSVAWVDRYIQDNLHESYKEYRRDA